MEVLWKSLLMVLAGVLLLRVAGRKSISQMTLAQTVVMISIGSIIIQPIVEDGIWRTLTISAIFIGALVLMEYLQLKFNFIEKFITGKSKIIIENGKLDVKMLRKLRFTVDQMEMRLRQQGISRIIDIKVATLEPNGMLGYELMPDSQPLTVGEFKKMMAAYIQTNQQSQNTTDQKPDIFKEIIDGVKQENPSQLH